MKTKVRKSRLHGRGVFATKKIRKGETVEVCPIILMPKNQEKSLHRTELKNYYFQWDSGRPAIALGNGSLYNHSYFPNAVYNCKMDDSLIITALETIKAGQEITVNYNGNPYCTNKVWFDE